jgi:protein TonB
VSLAELAAAPPGAASDRARAWTAGAAGALAAHAAAVYWILAQPPVVPIESGPPAAVMIELAPLPAAPAPVEEEQITPDPADQQEILSNAPDAPSAPPPPEAPPPVAMAEPELPTPEPPPTPVETPTAEALPEMEPLPELPSEVAAPRPVRRPPDLQVARAPEPEAEPREQPKLQAPRQETRQTRVEAPAPAPVAAAPRNDAGGRGAVSPAKWQSRLMAHLERRKRYPSGARRRGEEGIVYVRFSIDGNGNVRSAELVRSSGHAELDQAVIALVQRASPVPAPPPGAPHDITAPVRFNIR